MSAPNMFQSSRTRRPFDAVSMDPAGMPAQRPSAPALPEWALRWGQMSTPSQPVTPATPLMPPSTQSMGDFRIDDARKRRDDEFENFLKVLQQSQQIQAPPKPQQGFGYRDALPVGLLAILASLLGAKEGDIAQGLQGFIGGRQQWAAGENQHQMQKYEADMRQQEMQRQQAQEVAKLRYGKASEDFGYEDGLRREQIAQSKADEAESKGIWAQFLQSDLPSEKQAVGNELVKRGLMTPEQVAAAVADIQQKNNSSLMNRVMGQLMARGLDLQTEEGRRVAIGELMTAASTGAYTQDAIDRLRSELSKPTFGNEASRLKNEGLAITNQYLPQTLQARIDQMVASKYLSEQNAALAKIKGEYYPQYIQAIMNSGAIRDARNITELDNAVFKRQVDNWSRQHGDYLEGQYKRKNTLQAQWDRNNQEYQQALKQIIDMRNQGKTEAQIAPFEMSAAGNKAAMDAIKKSLDALDADIARVEKTAPKTVQEGQMPVLPGIVDGGAGTRQIDVSGGGRALGGGTKPGGAPATKPVPPKNAGKTQTVNVSGTPVKVKSR